MEIATIIQEVKNICLAQGVKHLKLFGSFATETATERSDIDFVVQGCDDIEALREKVDMIDTLRSIDLFDYDSIVNTHLLEDIKLYGKVSIFEYLISQKNTATTKVAVLFVSH